MSSRGTTSNPPFWSLIGIFCGFCAFFAIFFSPVLFGGKVFISDGQFAAFHSKLTLWSDAWAGGWPAAADLTQMMFSPLRNLLRHLPYGFNLFITSSYVLGGTFMFGYVYRLTRSHIAGTVSGLVLGLSGFMMAHLGHTSMIIGAAWTPLLLWALDTLREGYRPLWLGLGALAVCTMMLSGHPQITAYSCVVGGLYALALGFDAAPSKWRYWWAVSGVFTLGTGLAAVQWLPTYELSKETLRIAYTFDDFSSLSLPVKQVLMLFFPFLYGSQYGLFGDTYFGAWSYAELAGYAGVSSLVLSVVAVVARRDRLSMFWASVASVAVMLAVGRELNWLAMLSYQLPVLNQFRVPGRHVYEYALAVSVLAGLGVAALQSGQVSPARLLTLAKVVGAVFIVSIGLAALVYSTQSHAAVSRDSSQHLPVRLPAVIYVPAFWMASSVLILLFHSTSYGGSLKQWLILLLVALDMAGFGWFHDWRLKSEPQPRALWRLARDYSILAGRSGQKLINPRRLPLPPDLGRFFGVRSLNWYGPLMLQRYSDATGINTSGFVAASALSDVNVGLDIYGGRYLFIEPARTMTSHGLPWYQEPLGLIMGGGCGSKFQSRILLKLPVPVTADGLAMVTQLGCASTVEDAEPVGEIVLHGFDGRKDSVILRAGIETAEWAADCLDVIPTMRHRRATVFASRQLLRPNGSACDAHSYLGRPAFASTSVTAIEIRVPDNLNLNLFHLTLFDTKTANFHVINPVDGFLASKRWSFSQTADGVSVYENNRAMPPVWLAFEAIAVSPEQALAAVRTSVLPDGRVFDPGRQVLTEGVIFTNEPGADSTARVIRHEDTHWKIDTRSSTAGLLVVGQNYFAGWRATVDGIPVDLLRVNYSQQGVVVPAGDHEVVLGFRPPSFVWGLTISAVSSIVLLGLFWPIRPAPVSEVKAPHVRRVG